MSKTGIDDVQGKRDGSKAKMSLSVACLPYTCSMGKLKWLHNSAQSEAGEASCSHQNIKGDGALLFVGWNAESEI